MPSPSPAFHDLGKPSRAALIVMLKVPLGSPSKTPQQGVRLIVLIIAGLAFFALAFYLFETSKRQGGAWDPFRPSIDKDIERDPAVVGLTTLTEDLYPEIQEPENQYPALEANYPVVFHGGLPRWIQDDLFPDDGMNGPERETTERYFLQMLSVTPQEYLERCVAHFPGVGEHEHYPDPDLWHYNEEFAFHARKRSGRAFQHAGRLWSIAPKILSAPIVAEVDTWPEGQEGQEHAQPVRRSVRIERYFEALVAFTDRRACYKAVVGVLEEPAAFKVGDFVRFTGVYARPVKVEFEAKYSGVPRFPKFYAHRLAKDEEAREPSLAYVPLKAALAYVSERDNLDEYSIEAAAHNYLMRAVALAGDEQIAMAAQDSAPEARSYLELINDPASYRGQTVTYQGAILSARHKLQFPNEQGVREFWRVQVLCNQTDIVTVDVLERPPAGLVAKEDEIRFTGVFMKRWSYPKQDGGYHKTPLFVAKRIEVVPPLPRNSSYDIGLWVLVIMIAVVVSLVAWMWRRDRRESEVFMRAFIKDRNRVHLGKDRAETFNRFRKKPRAQGEEPQAGTENGQVRHPDDEAPRQDPDSARSATPSPIPDSPSPVPDPPPPTPPQDADSERGSE